MEKVQIKKAPKIIDGFFRLLAAYVCGGVMFTVIFAPRIKTLEDKINALDSSTKVGRPIAHQERLLIINKLDTLIHKTPK